MTATTNRTIRGILAGVFAAALAVIGLTVFAAPASAADGTLDVTVTFEGGAPATGGSVWVHSLEGGASEFSYVSSATAWHHAFALPPGEYEVSFGWFEGYAPERYHDIYWGSSIGGATHVTVADGATTAITEELAVGGWIEGTVTVEGGAPATGAWGSVQVSLVTEDGDSHWVTSVTPDETGFYRVSQALPPGNYAVQFWRFDYALDEYYHDATTVAEATLVPVTAGETSTVDEVLTAGGNIAGTVTMDSGGSAGVGWASVYRTSGEFALSSWTDADGSFVVGALPPGDYLVRFDYDLWQREWYNNVPDQASATPVTVVGGVTTTVNASVAPETSVEGTVTIAGGGSVQEGWGHVYLTNIATGVEESAYLLPDGGYRFRDVQPGTYRLGFVDIDGAFDEYYDNAASSSEATPIAVTPGDHLVLNAELAPDSSISGSVTLDGSGPALVGTVRAYSADGTLAGSDHTTDGDYHIDGLVAGTYYLSLGVFDGSFGSFDGAAFEWYDDAASIVDATPVVVGYDEDVVVDVDLSPVSTITANLTIEGVAPVTWGNIILTDIADGSVVEVGDRTTDGHGSYELWDVPPGTYRLQFLDFDGAVDEYYDNASSAATATPIVVAPGDRLVLDAELELEPFGTIAGTVTGTGGVPLEGAYVYAFNDECNYVASSWVDATGGYSIGGLLDGVYYVTYNPAPAGPSAGYIAEWWDDAPDCASATPVTIAAKVTVTADAELAPDSSISGSVTLDGSGAAVYGGVQAYAADGTFVGSDYTGDGDYLIDGLTAGTYYLWFGYFDGAASEWYDDAASMADATPVVVGDGADVVVDVDLSPEATITGTVTIAGSSADAIGRVNVFDGDGVLVAADFPSDYTGGEFTIPGLRAGTYYVQYTDFVSGAGVSEWYADAADLASAAPIVLGVGDSFVADAELAAGPALSGRVTDAVTGDPIPYARVFVHPSSGTTPYWYGIQADASGDWVFGTTGLPAFDYTIAFADPFSDEMCNSGVYACEYWGGGRSQDTATWFPVADGESISGLDAALDLSGSISGTVTPLLESIPARIDAWLISDPSVVGYASVDESGNYTIVEMPPGDYRVSFSDPCSTGYFYGCETPGNYTVSFYNGKSSAGAADLVTVPAGGAATGIDGTLVEGATLSGRVVDADNPTVGIPQLQVYVYDLDGGSFTNWAGYEAVANGWSSAAVTDANGYYEAFAPLPEGDYKVLFKSGTPGYSDDFAPAYWGGERFFETADVLTVTGTDPVTANGSLTRGGSISGTISYDGIAPYEAGNWQMAYAYAFNPDASAWEEVASAWTDESGAYTIPGLAAGSYRVGFHGHASNTSYLPAGWHGGTPTTYYDGQPTLELADDVLVVNGADTAGIDAILASNAITGTGIEATVTLAGGVPATDGCMYAYLDGNMWDPTVERVTCDGVDGVYRFTDLAPGEYQVAFKDFTGGVDEWYNPLDDESTYFVTVEDGLLTPIATELVSGGVVTGTVTDSLGNPVENVAVEVYPTVESDMWFATTDADGYFETSTLPVGAYRVHYLPEGDLAQAWYDTAASREAATWVAVTAGGTAVADQELPLGASIAGTVTPEGGGSLHGASVLVFDLTGGFVGNADILEDGTYSVTNLLPGDYRVQFIAPYQAFVSEWYENASDADSATVVSLGSGDVFEANAELAIGPSISGHVTDAATGLPLAGVYVNLEGAFYNNLAGYTDANGYYAVGTLGLPTNNYLVRAYDSDFMAGRAMEYYGGGYTNGTATPVPLSDGAVVSGIDIELDLTGSVSGRVTGVDNPEGVYPQVTYWRVDDPASAGLPMVFSQPDGSFTATRLAPGDYYFAFATANGAYAPEFWNDSATLAGAVPVTVGAGAAVTGIDATLSHGATISGRVVDEDNPAVGLGDVSVRVISDEGVVITSLGSVPASDPWASSAYTDADGYYIVDVGVGPGDYVVEFAPLTLGASTAYAREFWDGASFAEDADVLTITDGSPVTVNGALSSGGSISGTVSHDGLSPVSPRPDDGPAAYAFAYNPTSGEWEERANAVADATGAYTIPGLAAGTYRVGFHSHTSNTGYLPDYWVFGTPTAYHADSSTIGGADDVVVTGGAVTSGVNGLLRSVHLPATIAADGLAPAIGSSTGGTVVTITGEHFTGVTEVTFDGVAGAGLSVGSDTELTVTAPAHAAGVVDVVVTSPDGSSAAAVFTYAVPVVTLSGPATYVPGTWVPMSISVDPTLSGTGVVWYMPEGGVWTASTKTVTVTNGVGSTSLKPYGVQSYRIAFMGTTSNEVTLTPVAAVSLTAPATYVPGSWVSVSIAVDPALSGKGVVWYMPEGGAWTASTKTVTVTNGVGSTSLKPYGVQSYRIVFMGNTSNAVTLSPVATVTLSSPATYVPGSSVTVSVSVSPALSGKGVVWYMPDGGAWTATTKTITVTNGVGSTSLKPSGVMSYRIAFMGNTSNAVTLSPVAAVTLAAPATYEPGSPVSVSVLVDPDLTGKGVVWYMPEGGAWTATTKTVTVTNGVGSTNLNPSGVMSYRVVFMGNTSNEVTVTPVTPVTTVTLTAPTTYTPGSTVWASVSVSPASSGSGVVWYMPEGGAWTETTKTVTVTNGVGWTSFRPTGVMSYRVVFGETTSNELTFTPI